MLKQSHKNSPASTLTKLGVSLRTGPRMSPANIIMSGKGLRDSAMNSLLLNWSTRLLTDDVDDDDENDDNDDDSANIQLG